MAIFKRLVQNPSSPDKDIKTAGKDRYKQFRGEKIHIMVGEVNKFVKPTSNEGDAWSGKILMSLSSAIKVMKECVEHDHENMYPYRIAQSTVLNMLKN